MIGGYWTLTGPDTALGLDQKRAVEVAFDEIGNELIGHPIQFIAEDGLCSAEGGQAAATKLASIPNIVAVMGPDCSSSATLERRSCGTPGSSASERRRPRLSYSSRSQARLFRLPADGLQRRRCRQIRRQVLLRGSAVPDAGHDP